MGERPVWHFDIDYEDNSWAHSLVDAQILQT